MTNTQFVDALYTNLGGQLGNSAGTAYWVGLLNAGESRAQLVAQFVQTFQTVDLSSQAASGLSATDYATALARQQTFDDKITVSGITPRLRRTTRS